MNKYNHIIWNKNEVVDGIQIYIYKSGWKCNPMEDIMIGTSPNKKKI